MSEPISAMTESALIAKFETWYKALPYKGATKEALFHDWTWEELKAAEQRIAELEQEHALGDPLWPLYQKYTAQNPTPLLTYSGWLQQVARKLEAGEQK